MREKKRIFIGLIGIVILTFLIAFCINYFTEEKDDFFINVMLSIFGSSLLSAIVALIGYFSDKKHILKENAFLLLRVINKLSTYDELSNDEGNEKIKTLEEIYYIVVNEMASIHYEYSPFFRATMQNKFVFSSYSYLFAFCEIIKRNKNSMKSLKNSSINLTNAEAAIKTIEDYMYSMNDGNEIFVLQEELDKYIREYVEIVNGKHKGKYDILDEIYFHN